MKLYLRRDTEGKYSTLNGNVVCSKWSETLGFYAKDVILDISETELPGYTKIELLDNWYDSDGDVMQSIKVDGQEVKETYTYFLELVEITLGPETQVFWFKHLNPVPKVAVGAKYKTLHGLVTVVDLLKVTMPDGTATVVVSETAHGNRRYCELGEFVTANDPA